MAVDSRAEPLLEARGEPKGGTKAEICLLFVCKLVCGLANQVIIVFAPFLAQAAGGLSLAEYRWSLLATDLAPIVLVLLPLDRGSPRVLGATSMLAFAASFLLPQAVQGLWPLVVFRFASGVAWSVYGVVAGAVLSAVDEAQRTRAIAVVEMSWFLASFAAPAFGTALDAWGATPALGALLVAPAAALGLVCCWVLPATSDEGRKELPNGANSDAELSESTTSVAWRLGRLLTWAVLANASLAAFQVRYGGWLHSNFHMSATDLGLFSNAIAVGNLSGNFLTQLLGDKVLPARTVSVAMTCGLGLLSAFLAVLPGHVPVDLLFMLVFANFLFFECGFLTAFSYTTQVLGKNQMKGIAMFFAVLSLGRVVGDWLAVYPSMAALFGGCAAGYLSAAAALAGAPAAGRGAVAEVVSKHVPEDAC